LASNDRLKGLRNIEIIDDFAKNYGYSHEEAFLLNHDFALSLLLLHREQTEFTDRYNAIHKAQMEAGHKKR